MGGVGMRKTEQNQDRYQRTSLFHVSTVHFCFDFFPYDPHTPTLEYTPYHTGQWFVFTGSVKNELR
jgi:hypothetical protein